MIQPLVIVGCTASGKSDLAEALALHYSPPATILAVDSMQVYRRMDIGTAKPSLATRQKIPHAMIDVADPWESYSAARFTADARPILQSHLQNNSPLIIIGGTILYLRALLEGLFEGPSANPQIRQTLEQQAADLGLPALHAQLQKIDPLAASRIHTNDLRRIIRALEVHQITGTPISQLQTQWNRDHPAIQARFIGIHRDREILNRRINTRVRQMLYPPAPNPSAPQTPGLLHEVQSLHAHPRGLSKEAASGVGYRQILNHLQGRCSLDDAIEETKIATRHLAKLQRTWLKRFQNITWLDAQEAPTTDLLPQALEIARSNS